MFKKHTIIFILIILCFNGCKSTKVSHAPKQDSHIFFNILAINDVYEIAALNNGEVGGMARVAFVIDSLKKQNPNTFLMMAGDFLNPSLLGTLKYNDKRIKGKQMIEVMNAMKFDAVTFGNHEFDLKPEEFQERLNQSQFDWVSANVNYKGKDIVVPFYIEHQGLKSSIPKTKTLQIKGVNGQSLSLGLVSVTTDSNPREWVDYGDFIKDAEAAYALLEPETDIIIGFTHLSLEEDKEVARALPQLPLIIGGHEHDALKVKEGKTTIAKADANAKSAYLHKFKYNTKTENLSFSSTLIPINSNIPHQPDIKKIVDKWLSIQNREIEKVISNPYEVIYKTKDTLDGTDASGRNKQTNLGHLITKAMSYAYNDDVDAALVNGGSFRIDDELTGNISSFDIFRVLPFGGNLLKVKLSGQLLIDVLNYGRDSAGTGAYLQRYNLTWNKDNNQWYIGTEPIVTEKNYWIATSDFLLKGYDIPMLKTGAKGVLDVREPNTDTLASDIRKAVIAYLKRIK